MGPDVILLCVIVSFYDGCGGEVFCLYLLIVFEVRCLDVLLVLLGCFGDWYRSYTIWYFNSVVCCCQCGSGCHRLAQDN